MANESNLEKGKNTQFDKLTGEELARIAKKGGKKSVQVRAERKRFNELFNNYLDKKITNEQIKQQMVQFGFTDEECTNKNAMVFAQYKEALKGSTQAFIAVRDTMGEKPIALIEHSGNLPIVIFGDDELAD